AEQIELRLDANGAFTPDNALARLEQLALFGVFALEQPLKPGQPEALADVCRHSPIPIALDEELIGIGTLAEKERLLETVRPQHLVLKPSLIGGFSAAEEWIALADHFGIGWWVNSMLESNIGLSAICQWASSLPGQFTHGLGTGQLFTNNISGPLQLRGPALWYNPNVAWDLSVASIG
ncbi:MAG: enolase C-terminal domain-like protein, partial [Anaerolineae bacterium]|nr:enolase C-terminal domain-like protein [Anaerolineae bacterium]